MPLNILLIFIGGGLGSIARFLTSLAVMRAVAPNPFPLGTFIVNIIGCLLIGFIAGVSERFPVPASARLFLITGILGGFTTFSSFANESFSLFQQAEFMSFLTNVLGQVLFGLIAVYLGVTLARLL
jgi:CrcB protein